LVLLVAAWIAWAIHVGSTNGGSAAVGVLITWPLLALIVAGLLLVGRAIVRLLRNALGRAGANPGASDGEAEAGPGR